MNPVQFSRALREGRRVFGTLLVSASPHWPDALKDCGLDFVFIDTEHIAIDRHDLSWMCQTYRAAGLAPLVRIPAPDPYRASQVLDGGAAGIVAPYVESVGEVKDLVGAVKYRPLKGQRLRAILDGHEKPESTLREYLCDNNHGVLVINIESVPAKKNLEALLSVLGLDGILIGPHDLSCSLGVPEDYTGTKFRCAVSEIIGKARKAGLSAGIHATFPYHNLEEEIRYLRDAQANLVIHSADILLFRQALKKDINRLRAAGGAETERHSQARGVKADRATIAEGRPPLKI